MSASDMAEALCGVCNSERKTASDDQTVPAKNWRQPGDQKELRRDQPREQRDAKSQQHPKGAGLRR